MKKINIQRDLDSQARIARTAHTDYLSRTTEPQDNAQSQTLPGPTNDAKPQAGKKLHKRDRTPQE